MSELCMYIFVNTNLKMEKGKIAGQVGHAVESCALYMAKNNFSLYNKYLNSGRRKIVLKGTEEDMLKIIEEYQNGKDGLRCFPIRDLGLTQIKPFSLTAVSFTIMDKENAPDFIKTAKLL